MTLCLQSVKSVVVSAMDLERAIEIAKDAHAGVNDWVGNPYWTHVVRVIRRLVARFPDATLDEKIAAALHDVVEDCEHKGYTIDRLAELGVPPGALRILEDVSFTLPRYEGMTYVEKVKTIVDLGRVGSCRVKVADNEDNSDIMRIQALPEGKRSIANRYAKARRVLARAFDGVDRALIDLTSFVNDVRHDAPIAESAVWFERGPLHIYVRKVMCDWPEATLETLVISNVVVDTPGQGVFGRVLDVLENLSIPIIIENVHNERLADYIRRRGGYAALGKHPWVSMRRPRHDYRELSEWSVPA